MPIHNDSLGPTLPRNVPSHGPVRKALLNLADCGCLREWKEFLHLSKGRIYQELECLRFRLCISEQCWDPSLVGNGSLSASDRCVPYPKSVHHALTNKLHIAKNVKKDAYDHVSEKRRLLEEGHNNCPSRYGRDLKMAFKFVNSEVKRYGDYRRAEVLDEVKALIRGSPWQRMVNPSKVRNLAVHRVNTEELELLSLGGDFKLQIGDRSFIDVAAAFHAFDHKYRNDPAKPDLHRVKTELMSNIIKDRRLRRTYLNLSGEHLIRNTKISLEAFSHLLIHVSPLEDAILRPIRVILLKIQYQLDQLSPIQTPPHLIWLLFWANV